MSNQIEFRHLRYFAILADELHFRKASEKLFITQPGLSRQIKILEELMETSLFNRTKKSVQLTKAGEYLKEEVGYILNHLDHVVKQVKAIESGNEGEIRIGFVGSAMQKIIPELLLKMNHAQPGLTASLDELSNQQQIQYLLKDKLDIGFLRNKRIPKDLHSNAIYTETFSLVVPEHVKLQGSSKKNFKLLEDENFILFSSTYSPEYYATIMSIFDDQGFQPRITHKSVHANTIYRLVENKMGIAIVPTSLCSGFNLKVKFVELSDIPQRTTLYASWKKDNRNPALQKFISLLE